MKTPSALLSARLAAAEPLESRIAPATLVNPTTVTYTDVDFDLVTIKISKGTFADTPGEFFELSRTTADVTVREI